MPVRKVVLEKSERKIEREIDRERDRNKQYESRMLMPFGINLITKSLKHQSGHTYGMCNLCSHIGQFEF